MTLDILRTLVGFDYPHIPHHYPPYNIVRTESGYEIQIACAGFDREEIKATMANSTLTVTGTKATPNTASTYIHKGIANRSWTHRWTLESSVTPTALTLNNGILTIVITPQKDRPSSQLEIH